MSVTEKRGFFGVVADPQSYQNILYLLSIMLLVPIVIGVIQAI